MSAAIDVVQTSADARAQSRAPLVVLEPLGRILDELGIAEGPLVAEPLGSGHSNVTFLLRRGRARIVLRRPPRPPYAQSAHDVLREARIMYAARGAGLPVPKVLRTVEDEQILGVPFVLLEHVAGHAISASLPTEFDSPTDAQRIGDELVAALAAIHAVDVTTGPLARIARTDGYLERQLRRFAGIWDNVKTRDLQTIDRLAGWLAANRPTEAQTTLVHGDFRLGNMLFALRPPARLAAVLDWEMATLGDPLSDVGYLTATWAEAGEVEHPMTALSAATRAPGFPSRLQLAEAYERRTGRDIACLGWYEVLALWKSAIFLEASYRRHLTGSTDDPYFERLGVGVAEIAARAEQRVELTRL